MIRGKPALVAALAAAALAIPAAFLLGSSEREARRLVFANGGTGLAATDVQAALQELAARVQEAEGSRRVLEGASRDQGARLSAVQQGSADQALRMAGQEARLAALEARVAGAAPVRTRLDYEDSAAATVTPDYARLRDVGTFVKRGAESVVLLSWSTHADAAGDPGSFCDFQLRVDGAADSEGEGGGGRAVIYVPEGAARGASPVSASALFGRLAPGPHAVGVFVRGTARACQENYGNFPRSVLVEETPRG